MPRDIAKGDAVLPGNIRQDALNGQLLGDDDDIINLGLLFVAPIAAKESSELLPEEFRC